MGSFARSGLSAKPWFIAGFLCAFLCTSLSSRIAAADDDEKLLARYNAAYKSYRQLVDDNNFKSALPYAREAYELGEAVHGEESEELAGLNYNYGLTLLKVGMADAAYPVLDDALGRYADVYGENAFELASLLGHTAKAAAAMGSPKLASAHFKRALGIVVEHKGEQSPSHAKLALQAGTVLSDSGTAEAEDYLLQSHAIYRQTVGPKHGDTARVALQLGEYYLDAGQYQAAIPHLKSALAVFEAEDSHDKDRVLLAHAGLVNAYQNTGRSEAATEHCLAVGANLPEVHENGYRPLFRREPVYPEAARRAGREGHVLVQFDVDTSGFVHNVETVEVAGDESFEAAALEAVRQYRFAPRFVDGEAVPVEDVRARLPFKPEKSSG